MRYNSLLDVTIIVLRTYDSTEVYHDSNIFLITTTITNISLTTTAST